MQCMWIFWYETAPGKLSFNEGQHRPKIEVHHLIFYHRFVSIMPTPVLFVVFSFLLRFVDGTGTAMFMTVSYTLLAQLYSKKKGAIMVSDFIVEPHYSGHHRGSTVLFLIARFPLHRSFVYFSSRDGKLLSVMWLEFSLR